MVATKKSFPRIFNKNKTANNKYIEEYKTDFNTPKDLKKLLAFCGLPREPGSSRYCPEC